MEAKAGNKGFCSNYLLLNPEQATFKDIFRVLFSSNLKKRNFIDSSQERMESFGYRLLIFLSALSQKILLTISTPMAMLGSTLEDLLNFLPCNGGFFGLLKNILRGKNVIPDREAANYLSFVGYVDTRMELDRNIKYGDGMYYPALSMMACKAVYNNAAYTEALVDGHWKMEHLGFKDYWNDFLRKTNTQAFLFRDKSDDHDTIVICFRGTEPFNADDWCSDIDLSWYEFPNIGKIHSGFMKALGMQKTDGWPEQVVPDQSRGAPLAYYDIRDRLKDLLSKNPEAKFIVTGHSLGGALAILFPAILFSHDDKLLLERMEGVYTFGQPRVGDGKFGNYMEKNLNKNGIHYYRFVYCDDVVPRIPFDTKRLLFKHFGTCVYYNCSYEAKIVKEEPYKNYFSIWAFFPMLKSAIYEVIRSFTIEKQRGPEYKEGWLLFCVRVLGLVVPGLPAHCPQDYVNSTRLGSPVDVLFIPQKPVMKSAS
ncbi:uncharacterized protein LOC111316203 [Durio zibethinus]|uniref:Uncharacterized protein LOC111316203 n=1 Tax=Durio zibethinus TaxID=66656 RepID=A0A6P6B9Q9_DURZI|nr:uncharacterized protein LOC111316203 [Durio zibethinus]